MTIEIRVIQSSNNIVFVTKQCDVSCLILCTSNNIYITRLGIIVTIIIDNNKNIGKIYKTKPL